MSIKDIVFIIFALGFYLPAAATVYPIELDQRIDVADQITIGTVIEQECFWDAHHANIYTAHTIRVSAYLKERNNDSLIVLVTMGGVVDDEAQVVFPSVELKKGEEYMFFLQKEPVLAPTSQRIQARSAVLPIYSIYASVQGTLPGKGSSFVDFIGKKEIPASSLLRKIASHTGFQAKKPDGDVFSWNQKEVIVPSSAARQTITLKNAQGVTTTQFFAGTTNTDHELIISGSGFGTTPGQIYFPNSNNGGTNYVLLELDTDIVYWNDDEIRVKIPYDAGTGKLQVLDSGGTTVGTALIEIQYSIKSINSSFNGFASTTRQRIQFINFDDAGGYTIQTNTTSGFRDDVVALNTFESSLEKWQCNTGINFKLDKTGTTATATSDDISVVQYNANLPSGVLGVASSRYRASGNSNCEGHNTVWYLKEVDIEFLPNSGLPSGFSWNFSDNPPATNEFDFESVAMHELGHAHGMGHVINEDQIMHYLVANGQQRREPNLNEIKAGAYKMSYSTTANCISSILPMELHHNHGNCSSQGAVERTTARVKVYMEGLYDIQLEKMRTDLVALNQLPDNQPFNVSPYFYAGTETITTLPDEVTDWALLQLRDDQDMGQLIAQQAVLIRSDGVLMNTDGNDLITFTDVADDSYYLTVIHHSHLPVISSVPHTLTDDSALYDFTTSSASAFGSGQLKEYNGVFMLNSGDFDGNNVINNLDFNIWKQNSAAVGIYSPADADGNGIVNNQDYNLWEINRSKVGVLSAVGYGIVSNR